MYGPNFNGAESTRRGLSSVDNNVVASVPTLHCPREGQEDVTIKCNDEVMVGSLQVGHVLSSYLLKL